MTFSHSVAMGIEYVIVREGRHAVIVSTMSEHSVNYMLQKCTQILRLSIQTFANVCSLLTDDMNATPSYFYAAWV